MAATALKLVIVQGDTFTMQIRWEALPYVYTAITAIAKGAPCIITAPLHGLVTGWRAAVRSVLGMTDINTVNTPPRDTDFHQITVIDTNTISLNDVDSSLFGTYVSGGYLQSFTPVVLTGFSARMEIKDRIGGTILASLTSGTPDFSFTLDNTNHLITLTIPATIMAAYTFTKGVYDLELVSPGGVVTKLYSGQVVLTQEVTT